MAYLPDPEAERERKRLYELHFLTWARRDFFEDITEKDRDPELWKSIVERYGPVFLGLIWKGHYPGREEYLAAGVDFTLAYTSNGIGVPKYGAPGPDTPRKL